ncbi:hypothetical protein HPB48_003660 [Haemaphysalis longicornis]|uniref:Uncharacterized protein n=1 Tax=Haemaphysalis longicornis TaxID=44386 RepID=A0A9J6FG02_HAELO|nr:hypothetical protein HPB48_003660 [Haemaphysalis longicornis]
MAVSRDVQAPASYLIKGKNDSICKKKLWLVQFYSSVTKCIVCRTMKQECPAAIVVATRRASQALEITKADLNHNHEVSSQTFSFCPESRRLTSEEQEYVPLLLELNMPPSLVTSKLHETAGK